MTPSIGLDTLHLTHSHCQFCHHHHKLHDHHHHEAHNNRHHHHLEWQDLNFSLWHAAILGGCWRKCLCLFRDLVLIIWSGLYLLYVKSWVWGCGFGGKGLAETWKYTSENWKSEIGQFTWAIAGDGGWGCDGGYEYERNRNRIGKVKVNERNIHWKIESEYVIGKLELE